MGLIEFIGPIVLGYGVYTFLQGNMACLRFSGRNVGNVFRNLYANTFNPVILVVHYRHIHTGCLNEAVYRLP